VKLRELATRLECRLDGDGDIEIVRVAGIHDAGPGDVTFLANPKYEKALAGTRASAVILHTDGPAAPCAALRSAEPYLAFARAVGLFAPGDRPAAGVHALTAIAPDAQLGADVSIGPFVVVGAGASIGNRTVVYPNVTIGPGVRIGDDCVVHANVSSRERV
jgi:UDP-3-O-[3-hydroxymyristoyl] glucosamine N-acyltransferase